MDHADCYRFRVRLGLSAIDSYLKRPMLLLTAGDPPRSRRCACAPAAFVSESHAE